MEEVQAPPPLVSVLVVSYNCAAALRRSLAALEASNDRDKMEILVVDNGSVDGSPEVAAEFPHVILLKLPRNFGYTKAVNIGMRTAKGEFYFCLDPNVEVLPETVTGLAARLTAETDAAGVCPLLEPAPDLYQLPMPETVSRIARTGAYLPASPPDLAGEKIAVEFPSFAAFMVRSYFLKGLRYIDERYAQTWADAEIALQIRRAGKKILLFPGIRATRRPPEEPPPPMPPAVRALLASDWAAGAAVYAGKHFGFFSGLKVRLGAIFASLGSLLRFRDSSYCFSRLVNVVSGSKVDGTQLVM
jgi:glycosyltransferase involved in cell wall biosynthesis